VPAELLAPLAIITAWWRDGRGHGQQFPAAGQAFRAVAVTEETVVADALKRVREDMQQEAPQELVGRQGHHFLLVLVFIVLVAEADLPVLQLSQPVIGDGDTMRVAGQIVQHAIGSAEGRLGVDHPFPAAERSQISGEAGRDGQVLQLAVEAQFTGRMDLLQGTEVDLSEAAGQYAYG